MAVLALLGLVSVASADMEVRRDGGDLQIVAARLRPECSPITKDCHSRPPAGHPLGGNPTPSR
ncbi:MAG: hypothetical protein M3347_12245 [Armatimonadota bacterium]|nr:hypothetical protein [Armatimonadota bacterium]